MLPQTKLWAQHSLGAAYGAALSLSPLGPLRPRAPHLPPLPPPRHSARNRRAACLRLSQRAHTDEWARRAGDARQRTRAHRHGRCGEGPQRVRDGVPEVKDVLEEGERECRERHVGELDVHLRSHVERGAHGERRIDRARSGRRLAAASVHALRRVIGARRGAHEEEEDAVAPRELWPQQQARASTGIRHVRRQEGCLSEHIRCEPLRAPEARKASREATPEPHERCRGHARREHRHTEPMPAGQCDGERAKSKPPLWWRIAFCG